MTLSADRDADKIRGGGARAAPVGRRPRLALIADYVEEGWPSMDLVADMLLDRLRAEHADEVAPTLVRPPYRARAGRLPAVGESWLARSADRLLGRFVDYPRHVRRIRASYDLFHILDHTYAHLACALPPERTCVTCHDIDAFRCLLPGEPARSAPFRAMSRLTLRGLQRASVVFCISRATRDDLISHQLVHPDRLVVAPLGPAPEFNRDAPAHTSRQLWPGTDAPFLLHVGNPIPRKRLDVLLAVFARVHGAHPELRLVRVGGPFPPEQEVAIDRLGLRSAITRLTGLTRDELADLYRRALAVLQPSEAEGFGLPIIEALACGAVVIASDLAVLREVGGEAAIYCQVGDVAGWTEAVDRVVRDRAGAPSPERRHDQAIKFSWSEHARRVADGYRRLGATDG